MANWKLGFEWPVIVGTQPTLQYGKLSYYHAEEISTLEVLARKISCLLGATVENKGATAPQRCRAATPLRRSRLGVGAWVAQINTTDSEWIACAGQGMNLHGTRT